MLQLANADGDGVQQRRVSRSDVVCLFNVVGSTL